MNELIIYAVIFALLIFHCLLAGKMYRTVHQDDKLSFKEKNDWKLKALVFPAYFWFLYKQERSRNP